MLPGELDFLVFSNPPSFGSKLSKYAAASLNTSVCMRRPIRDPQPQERSAPKEPNIADISRHFSTSATLVVTGALLVVTILETIS